MRYGTRTINTRKWTDRGYRPECQMKDGYSYCYLFQATQPSTGRTFEIFLPNMDGICFRLFMTEFAKRHPGRTMIMDNAGCHHVRWDNGSFPDVSIEYLSPYSPDFNPQERMFQEIRKCMKGKFYKKIEPITKDIIQTLKSFWENPQKVRKTTAWE